MKQLADEIEAVLLTSSPDVQVAETACPSFPKDMDPAQHSRSRKLLVLVGSEDGKFRDESWYRSWESDKYQANVMTVAPQGDFKRMLDDAILNDEEHLLRRINLCCWKDKVSEAVPAILARAEITSSSSRLFISYRRIETLPLALQLFDELTHQGLEVFLDRFSIPPGYDFQRRLNQELQDKSKHDIYLSYRRHGAWPA